MEIFITGQFQVLTSNVFDVEFYYTLLNFVLIENLMF